VRSARRFTLDCLARLFAMRQQRQVETGAARVGSVHAPTTLPMRAARGAGTARCAPERYVKRRRASDKERRFFRLARVDG